MKHRIIRILPPLLDQSLIAVGCVLHKAVTIDIAVMIDPIERILNVGPELLNESLITSALIVFACQHYEERSRVYAAVISCKRNLSQIGHFTAPQLVQDFPRFCFARLVHFRGLGGSEELQNSTCNRGIDPQGFERRNDSVASEDSAEPGYAGVGIVPFLISDGH